MSISFVKLSTIRAWLITASIFGGVSLAVSDHGHTALASRIKDPLSLFAERSPGVREPGALTQTKRVRSLPNASPHERVLSNIRTRSADPDAVSDPGVALAANDIPLVPSVDEITQGINSVSRFTDAGNTASFGPGGGLLTGSIGGGAIVGGGGSSGAGPVTVATPAIGNTGTTPNVGDAVSPAIPEPATWLSMIVGFLTIGLSLRAGRSTKSIRFTILENTNNQNR